MKLFENALQMKLFENAAFLFSCGLVKTELFENAYVTALIDFPSDHALGSLGIYEFSCGVSKPKIISQSKRFGKLSRRISVMLHFEILLHRQSFLLRWLFVFSHPVIKYSLSKFLSDFKIFTNWRVLHDCTVYSRKNQMFVSQAVSFLTIV